MAPEHYEIRVEGVLGERWTGWFEGLQVSSEEGDGDLRAADRSGRPARVLVKIRDLGMRLISVRRVNQGDARKEAQP